MLEPWCRSFPEDDKKNAYVKTTAAMMALTTLNEIPSILMLAVALTWHLSVICGTETETVIRSLEVELSTTGVLKSPLFPNCCTPLNVTIHVKNGGYLRMVFDDLDLPPQSILHLFDGESSSSLPFSDQPRFRRSSRTWSRPVIASSSDYIFIYFVPGKVSTGTYVGFRATYWTVQGTPDTWTLAKPFTECPIIKDVMDSGEVHLGVLRTPASFTGVVHHQLDCVWQLKPPLGSKDLSVYFKVTEMNIEEGRLQILDGLTSESSSLKEMHTARVGTLSGLNLAQPRTGFIADDGLYIRLEKQTTEGQFNFIYGTYEKTSSDQTGSDCTILLDETRVAGFKCKTWDWCIPKENQCNTLANCPDNSDELGPECAALHTTSPKPTKTTTPRPTRRPTSRPTRRPTTQNKCSSWEKECPDGTCEGLYDNCSLVLQCQGQGQPNLKVDFAIRTTNKKHFKWPNGKDKQLVEPSFVLAVDLHPEPATSRAWLIAENNEMDEIFQIFHQVYF